MNKELIDLQRGSKATCAVIRSTDVNKLENTFLMDSREDNSILFGAKTGNPVFKDKVDNISRNGEIGYFVILDFDLLNEDEQRRYISLIKDREFLGYTLPDNVIIVLTVDKEESLKEIIPDVYHFCVVSM